MPLPQKVIPDRGLSSPLAIEGYDRSMVLAHAELLLDDGLIEGRAMRNLMEPVEVVIPKSARKLSTDGVSLI